MEREVVYHTNNPNYVVAAPVLAPTPQLIGPPVEDKLKQKEEQTRSQRKQLDPIPRFTGMSPGTLNALKSDLSVIANNELKRSIIQATNPYYEFAKFLMAAGSNPYTMDTFLYTPDFYDNDDGIYNPNGRYDIKMRGRNNNVDSYKEYLQDEEEDAKDPLNKLVDKLDQDQDDDEYLSSTDRYRLTKDLARFDSWAGYVTRFLSSNTGQKIRDFLLEFHKRTKGYWTTSAKYLGDFYAFSSQWVSDKFNWVLNKIKTIPYFGALARGVDTLVRAGFHTAGSALATIWNASKDVWNKTVTEYLKPWVKEFTHASIQSKFGQSPMSQLIGNQVQTYLANTMEQTDTDYHQLIEAFIERYFMAAYNELASKLLKIPVSTASKTPPDVHEFQIQLFYSVIQSSMVGVSFPGSSFAPIGINISYSIKKPDENGSADSILTKIYESMRVNYKEQKIRREEKFYANLLPTATLFNALSDLDDTVRQDPDKSNIGFWTIHPVREFLYQLKPVMDENIEKIRKELIEKINEQVPYDPDLEIPTDVKDDDGNPIYKDLPKTNEPKFEYTLFNRRLRKLREVKQTALENAQRTKDLLLRIEQQELGALNKANMELKLQYKKQYEEAQEALENATKEYEIYEQKNKYWDQMHRDMVQQVKDTCDNITKEIDTYRIEWSQKFKKHVEKWNALANQNNPDQLRPIKKAIQADIDQLSKDIKDVRDEYVKRHYTDFRARYEHEYKMQAHLSQAGIANKIQMEQFVQNKLKNDTTYDELKLKVEKAFKYLIGVASMRPLVNGIGTTFFDPDDADYLKTNINTKTIFYDPNDLTDVRNPINNTVNYTATQQINMQGINIEDISMEAMLAKMEVFIGVGHLLQYMKHEVALGYINTDDVSNPILDTINSEEKKLIDRFKTKLEDDQSIELAMLRSKDSGQKEFEQLGKDSWRHLKNTGKYFIYDLNADERYNTFMMLNIKVTPLELNFHAVVFKEKMSGCIQMAADEINLCARNGQTPFEVNQLIVSPYINGNFAKFVMFIYEGRSRTNPSVMMQGLAASANNNLQIQARPPHRTRFQMSEDGQYMEGVINFFRDVQFDPAKNLLVYQPGSSQQPLPAWQLARVPAAHRATQNYTINIPVLQPYLITSNNKRQRIDFHY